MPFGLCTRVGPRNHAGTMMGVHTGDTWRMRLKRPCAAAMRPYVKLLWPLVYSTCGVVSLSICVSAAIAVRPHVRVWINQSMQRCTYSEWLLSTLCSSCKWTRSTWPISRCILERFVPLGVVVCRCLHFASILLLPRTRMHGAKIQPWTNLSAEWDHLSFRWTQVPPEDWLNKKIATSLNWILLIQTSLSNHYLLKRRILSHLFQNNSSFVHWAANKSNYRPISYLLVLEMSLRHEDAADRSNVSETAQDGNIELYNETMINDL